MSPSALLNALYLGTCISTAILVVRNRWSIVQPGLSAFLFLNALQATSCVLAGEKPSVWYSTSVWAPVEVIVLEAAVLAAMEVTWDRFWMVGAGLAGAARSLGRLAKRDQFDRLLGVRAWGHIPPWAFVLKR